MKGDHAGRKHKGEKEGINAPSQQTIVQPKLELTTPGDSYEREADRMADFVMRKAYRGLPTEMPSTSSVLPPLISRRASSSTSGVAVDKATESGIHASRGGGQPMPTALRSQMESGFEADFSGVRLHTGSAAEAMSNDLSAKAFTYGNDIYFNRGQYSPDTTAGQHLIAHELTHVLQQSGKVGREGNNNNHPMDSYIRDQDWIRDYVLSDEAYTILRRNYEQKERKQPITVIIYTDARAACHENDNNGWVRSQDPQSACAFEEKNRIEFPERKGREISGLIERESGTNIFMLQGLPKGSSNDLDKYQEKLKELTARYGPLSSLIIAGHGSTNSVELNDGIKISTQSEAFFKEVKELFKNGDEEVKYKLPHSVLFAECLTGAATDTPEGLVNYVKCIMGSDVLVRGNKAAAYDGHVDYGHFNTNKECCDVNSPLTFTNHEDPTSPVNGVCASYSNRPKDRTYLGRNIHGALHEIKKHIESKAPYSLSLNYNLFPYDEISVSYYDNQFNNKKIKIPSQPVLDLIKQKITSEPDIVSMFIDCMLSYFFIENTEISTISQLQSSRNYANLLDIFYDSAKMEYNENQENKDCERKINISQIRN